MQENQDKITAVELEESLKQVEDAKVLISETLSKIHGDINLRKSTPEIVTSAYEKALPTLESAIAAFKKIIESLDEIRQEVLGPVNDAIHGSRDESIRVIKNSSKQSDRLAWVSIIFGILGFAVGVYGLNSSGFFSGEQAVGSPVYSLDSIAYSDNSIITEVETYLGISSVDGLISNFENYLADNCAPNRNCFEGLKNRFEQDFSKLSMSALDEKDRGKIAYLWMLVKAHDSLNKDEKYIRSIITSLDRIIYDDKLQEDIKTKASFLKGQLLIEQDNYEEAYDVLSKQVVSLESPRVYSLDEFEFFEAKEIKDALIPQLRKRKRLSTVRIVLLNETLPKQTGFAERAKAKLVDAGYKPENIITSTGGEASKIYGYYADNDNLGDLNEIISVIYRNPRRIGIDRTQISNTIVSSVKSLCKTHNCNVLIRLPREE